MAAAGDLDTGFGRGGKKRITFRGTDAAQAVLVQPNGRIVVAGGGGPASSFCVVRLRSDGRLDTTFGARGKRLVDFGGDDEGAFGAALQPDGKIVLVGDADFQPAVARLNADGSLDATFSGDGKRILSWGAIGRATAVIVLPNGKLLVGGFSGPEGGNMQVARLTPSGALDGTFGVGGIATIDFGGDDFGLAMARQANGRILLAGRSTVAGAVVARLRANGEIDPDFGGGDGRVALGPGSLTAVHVQPDRKIVVAGTGALISIAAVTRLRQSGVPDTTFAGTGTATIDIDVASDAVLQADGRIVVVGSEASPETDIAVARLNANGTPDTTFGSAGKATIDFGPATFGNAVALQANGRIVVGGQRTGADDFAVARLRG